MTPIAITFLVLSALVIWGGLTLSIVLLRRDVPEEEDETDQGAPPRAQRPQPHRSPKARRSGRNRRR